MADIVSVLLVPAEGDPGGLLAARNPWYGFPPPTVTRSGELGWRIGRDVTNHMRVVMTHWALPLWWDGALVPEGWDRARRVQYDAGDTGTLVGVSHPDRREVEMVARWMVSGGLASRVVRLARVDGHLVEVACC